MKQIIFTRQQILAWAAERLPNLKPTGKDLRGPCPIHNGTRPNFWFNPQTGGAFCHSECGRGWGIVGLEAALTGATEAEALREVCRIIGAPEPNGNQKGRFMPIAEYSYTDETGVELFQIVRFHACGSGEKNFVARRRDESGQFVYNLKDVRRVLYRLPRIRDAESVYIVEGEKDVHTLEAWGLAATTNPSGAGNWRPEYSQSLRGKDCIIVPDNDEKGRAHADSVRKALSEIARSVLLIGLPGLSEKGDVTDWKESGGDPDTLSRIVAAARMEAFGRPQKQLATGVPPGFESSEEGLAKLKHADKGTERIWLCAPLEVVALTRDASAQNWGRLICFRDFDGMEHEIVLPEASFASAQGEWFAILKAGGLATNPAMLAKNWIRDYLTQSNPSARVRTVEQIGWQPGGAFVTPEWTVPSNLPERIVLQSQGEAEHYFKQLGTLLDWRRNVAVLCVGNPILLFSVCLGFAPVLLRWFPGLSGGFHLAGGSSTGKSTSLAAAGSVWGGGGRNGFVESWNATANGLEGTARSHNHVLLPLDELKELAAEHAGRAAYSLAAGVAKERMTKSIQRRPRARWALFFLSAGEIGFGAHIQSAEPRTYAGQEVRVPEIPCDIGRYGCFEELHGMEDAAAFSKLVVAAATERAYGSAGPAFVEAVHAMGPTVHGQVEDHMRKFAKQFAPRDAHPTVMRTLDRFALVAAAGELATEAGVTGWTPGAAFSAVGYTFNGWLKTRGTAGSIDDLAAVRHFRNFVMQNEHLRFQVHTEGAATAEKPRQGLLGYVGLRGNTKEYQFLGSEIPREITGPYSSAEMAKALHRERLLQTEGNHKTVKRSLPGPLGRVRCTVVRAGDLFRAFDGDDTETEIAED